MFIRCLPALLFVVNCASAQSCLALSSAVTSPGGTVDLDLTLTSSSGELPAALQWTFTYTSSIRSLTVNDGPAAVAAGKTVMCNENSGTYTCVVIGANAKTIPNGIVAKVKVILAPDTTNGVIQAGQALGALPDGYYTPILSGSGTITTASVSPDRRLRPPLRRVAGICQSAQ